MSKWTPIVSNAKYSCLTMQTWENIGLKTLGYSIIDLLIKPGLDLLMQVPSLADYIGWSGEIYLDTNIPYSKNSNYIIKSPYDGSTVSYSHDQINQLIKQWQIRYNNINNIIISNLPLDDAISGIVYTLDILDGKLDLKSEDFFMDYEKIDKNCSCPTCSDGLTRAYLHYLYSSTPLLCQRLLMQHNSYWVLN